MPRGVNNIEQNSISKSLFNFLKTISIIMIFISFVGASIELFPAIVFFVSGLAISNRCAKLNGDMRPFYKKPWQIVILIAFPFFWFTTNPITSIELQTDLSQKLRINENQSVVINYEPSYANNLDKLNCYVKNPEIADLRLLLSEDGKLTYELIPKSSGKTSIECVVEDYQTSFEFEVEPQGIIGSDAFALISTIKSELNVKYETFTEKTDGTTRVSSETYNIPNTNLIFDYSILLNEKDSTMINAGFSIRQNGKVTKEEIIEVAKKYFAFLATKTHYKDAQSDVAKSWVEKNIDNFNYNENYTEKTQIGSAEFIINCSEYLYDSPYKLYSVDFRISVPNLVMQ